MEDVAKWWLYSMDTEFYTINDFIIDVRAVYIITLSQSHKLSSSWLYTGAFLNCLRKRFESHVALCTKCQFLPFWNRIREDNSDLTCRQVLMIVKLRPIKSKLNSPLKITKLFQFQNLTPSFPQFSMTVARCYRTQRLNKY